MVAAEGIEPSHKAYETFVLPLNYAAKNWSTGWELNPRIPRLKGECLKPNWPPVEEGQTPLARNIMQQASSKLVANQKTGITA